MTPLIQRVATVTFAVAVLLQAGAAARAGDLIEGLTRYAMLDYGGAIEVLRPLADQGEAVAQEILGKIHLTGPGTDHALAFKRLHQAAEQGRVEAQLELGRMYRDGVGLSADGKMAMYWFGLATKQGLPDAYNAMGESCLGHVFDDATAARRFFVHGSQLGHAGAMFNLGMIYLEGRGVGRDDIEAYKWFELSAQAGIGQERERALRALSVLRERLTPLQVGRAMAAANAWPDVAMPPL